MTSQIRVLAAACLLVCLSVVFVDVVDGGKCPYIPFCDEFTYNNETRRATCTKCEASNLYGLTEVNGFSRCLPCSENDGCLKCKDFTRCDLCRFPAEQGPDFDGRATCSACAKNCRNCAKSGSGKCDYCRPGNRKVGDQCESCAVPNCNYCDGSVLRCSACAPGYYLEDNQCKPCIGNCRTCANSETCNICMDYYFLDDGGRRCQPCPDNCKKCLDFGQCQICKLSYYLDNNKKCSPCEDNCLVCTGKGKCTYCKKGRAIDGSCACADNCKSCENLGFGKCDACLPGFVQSDSKGCKRANNKD
jgi:hypothetical protein